jgi:hypothetical protein
MKCKCKLESKSVIEDLSIGGQFSFNLGEEYEFYIEDDSFGKAYIVVKNRIEIGFDEKKFHEIFEIV